MTTFTLTSDQEEAKNKFLKFLINSEPVMVIEGYSGCGKSALIKELLEASSQVIKLKNDLTDEKFDPKFRITATTNKAADNLRQISLGYDVTTIHSLLGIKPRYNPTTNTTSLEFKKREPISNEVVFIDEASYINLDLLKIILHLLKDSKIVFLGDPAQLTAVRSSTAPVFSMGFPTVKLTQVVRQANSNQIIEVSTKFRETVNTGEYFSFIPNNKEIIKVESSEELTKIIEAEFCRADWKFSESKILTWTNKTSIAYNQYILKRIKGTHELEKGDYAQVNKYVQNEQNSCNLKTDQTIYIQNVNRASERFGIPGVIYTIEDNYYFCPNDWEQAKKFQKECVEAKHYGIAESIENTWIDLRSIYSCTTDKAQGSTYNKVFVDLNDMKNCTDMNRLARMLYVAISRAKDKCYLIGDLV